MTNEEIKSVKSKHGWGTPRDVKNYNPAENLKKDAKVYHPSENVQREVREYKPSENVQREVRNYKPAKSYTTLENASPHKSEEIYSRYGQNNQH